MLSPFMTLLSVDLIGSKLRSWIVNFTLIFSRKMNIPPIFYTAYVQNKKYWKRRLISANGKNLSVPNMFIQCFTRNGLPGFHLKRKQLPPQKDFFVPQQKITLLSYLAQLEPFHPFEIDDCLFIRADCDVVCFWDSLVTKLKIYLLKFWNHSLSSQ